MNNYKIKVNNESESKEAQEYFFALGYVWADTKCQTQMEWTCSCWYSCFEDGDLCLDRYDVTHHHKELCIAELQDLVILHRNDVSDATHVGRSGSEYFVAENDAVFFFDGSEWIEKQVDVNNLKPINKSEEQGLISGADALAMVHTCTVQYSCAKDPVKDRWTTITDHFWDQYNLGVFLNKDTTWKFRIKPRTIKLELEIPAPFEPKEGEKAYRLAPIIPCGYTEFYFDEDENEHQFGAWDSEEKVKQVVAAFRGIKG
ncbi:hypothetical protein QLH32_04805 [Acinetobacter corruptisaponis]|uniref:Uncharacterized protein n=1 Tax=Acinetobacter corruptisaponis TaxID=3045147 RepID=A0ABY8S517_9GAMM|nr:hypothetical protein [Acinetobacter sp. KCTC 92772]WHP06795.1 hypothetical protein QLH32_04805 [Acinetobacter sp. KCTC 92772]